ncbi:hypothetical protein ACIF6K_26595 [Streptomyces sp. NPDC085942]|uniref:hypothetical protein n=1 Tax=Streptomyces sp. NPDC085942 TaxID=3365743 RepID=UPI0037D686B3
MTTTPVAAVRQALDDAEAALARLRPALADAYGLAEEGLTAAATALDQAEQRAALAHASRRAKAAQLDDIKRALLDTGVIQEGDPYSHADLADVIRQAMTDRDHAEQGDASAVHLANSAAREWQQDAERFKADHLAACKTIAEMHEAATGRTGMGPIRGVVEDVADVRTRAEQAEAGMTEIAKAYDRHRRSLAAIFARPAETPFEEITEDAAKTLTRVGARLAAAEEARAEAKRVANRATTTLLRIKHARTAADAWAELGTYYHLPATEAGRRARAWRSVAERHATERAEAASVVGARYMGDAERFHAAWHSARLRAQRNASDLRVAQASRRRWKRRTRAAEQLLATVRQYLAAAYPDDIASGVRDDLALILDGRPAEYAPLEGQ